MSGGKRPPGPVGGRGQVPNVSQLRLQQPSLSLGGAQAGAESPFGLPRLHLDEGLDALRLSLGAHGRTALWQLVENARLNLTPPVPLPRLLPRAESRCLRLVFGPLPPEQVVSLVLAEGLEDVVDQIVAAAGTAAQAGAEALARAGAGAARALNLAAVAESKMTFWAVYENDGNPPFNPGLGSDQGPTAALALFVTFDDVRKGLTKVGWTVIDMRTPRGHLPKGAAFNSDARYTTSAGGFAGISAVDFEVTVERNGQFTFKVIGSAGIDSSWFGKKVQDAIHEHVSNSPLFPWPKDQTKLFAEVGAAALYTPRFLLTQGEVLGVHYEGRLEFGAEARAGTHGTEGTVEASVVIGTRAVKTKLGDVKLEIRQGVFGRAFLRYNDGRESLLPGVEGGAKGSVKLNIGRFGIGIGGTFTKSTDPALQTDLPTFDKDARPHQYPFGAPAGSHGVGQVFLSWTF